MNRIAKENIVETTQYKQGVKQLIKKHKTETLNSLKSIIDDLCGYKITTQYHNHKLTNIDAYELHVNNEGDVLLLYRYSGNALIISLQLIDLTNHRELKNKKYQKEIKKTIKDLKENKGDKNMEYMEYTTTNGVSLSVRYKWKNTVTDKETIFDYEVPYEMFMDEVRNYFDRKYDVKIDGKDNDIWNMLVDLGEQYDADILQDIMDDTGVQTNLTKALEKDAKEMFDALCHEEAEEEDDDLEESLTESKKTEQDWENELEDDNSEIFHVVNSLQSQIDYGSPYADAINRAIDDIHDAFISGDKKDLDLQLATARVSFLDNDSEDDLEDEYPEMQVSYRVYFTDKDGDELYAVDDGDYGFEATYDTKEEALDAMKKILQDPKVKADDEIGGCHSVFIADEDEWDEDPEGNYDAYGYEPTEVVDEVKKD